MDDGMVIQGVGGLNAGGVTSHGDHRIAMSMAIAALHGGGAVQIDDTACTETSFPGFWETLSEIGAVIG